MTRKLVRLLLDAIAKQSVVALRYNGTWRLIVPSDIHMSRTGTVLLSAIRYETNEHRTYRFTQIEEAVVL